MTGSDETWPEDASTSMPRRRSRFFWTTFALAIGAMLLLCTFLILIAATRS